MFGVDIHDGDLDIVHIGILPRSKPKWPKAG
jgi:hypothetical protein